MKYFITLLLFAKVLFSQKQNVYKIHTLAFYNVENLFDAFDDPEKKDELSPMMAIKPQDRALIYQKKIHNIAQVLRDLGAEKTKSPPTLLGVCEIENAKVLQDLLQHPLLKNMDYDFVHRDSPDLRGIDVGFVYRKGYFSLLDHKSYTLRLYNDTGLRIHTRDVLVVSGYLEEELIHILINHFPSRRGGKKRSERHRIRAALLNRRIIDSIFSIDEHAKIFAMGDFNDNPDDKSIHDYLVRAADDDEDSEKQTLYNPYEKMFENGHHTLVHWGAFYLFDQIIMSRAVFPQKRDFNSWQFYRANIFNPSYLITPTGRYKGYPYRSFSAGGFTGGFSDHYHCFCVSLEKTKPPVVECLIFNHYEIIVMFIKLRTIQSFLGAFERKTGFEPATFSLEG